MECGEISKQLKPFLGDLLSEEERRTFLDHLESCARCKQYARSIGDLSNQLWKLGQVSVPPDFASTVLFKLEHPVLESRRTPETQNAAWPRAFAGVLIVALVLGALLFGLNRFKNEKPETEAPRDLPAPSAETPQEEYTGFGAPMPASPAPAPDEAPPAAASPPDNLAPPLSVSQPSPAHWHLVYAGNPSGETSKEETERKQLLLRQLTDQIRTVRAQIESAKKKQFRELGRPYSEEARRFREQERRELDFDLARQIERLKRLEAQVKYVEENLEEKRRKDDRNKERLLQSLGDLGIRPEVQAADLLVFSASAGQTQRVLASVPVKDFTASATAPSPDREQHVSVYLEGAGVPGFHWHAASVLPRQKAELFDMIREMGGTVDHRSPELAVLSMSESGIGDLSARFQARGVRITEFGRPASKRTALSSVPLKLSIYFTD